MIFLEVTIYVMAFHGDAHIFHGFPLIFSYWLVVDLTILKNDGNISRWEG